MNDEEPLSPGQIAYLVSLVREGKHDQAEARSLLLEFVRCVDSSQSIPEPLAELVRDAFRSYLQTGASLEKSFGVKRAKRGRESKITKEVGSRIASSLWRHRLAGVAHQDALEIVAGEFGIKTTLVGTTWRTYVQGGLDFMLVYRGMFGPPWSPEEKQRMEAIRKDNGLDVLPLARRHRPANRSAPK